MLRKIAAALLAAVILAACFAPAYSAEWTPPVQPVPANIGAKIELQVNGTTSYAGMATAVFDAENEIYSGCFGYINKEKQRRTDQDSVFEWGSVTKLTVWTSVMQLYERGMIELDRDIRDYLPEGFLKNLRYDDPITMTDLMNHKAGFQETYYDIFVSDKEKIEPLGAVLSKHQPEQIFEPGTVTAYSNWSTALAGYIVELVSGQEYYEYVNENIFAPLEMKHTSVKPDHSDNEFVLEHWEMLECYDTSAEPLPFSDYYVEIYPAGSGVSTIGDFEKFARALLTGKGLFEKEDTHRLMFTPTSYYKGADIPKNCHGLWMIPFGRPVYGHGGNTVGCSSSLMLDIENGVGMVIMTNQQNEVYLQGGLLELMFGKFNSKTYFPDGREIPDGFYKPARGIFENGFKVSSIGFRGFDSSDRGEFWVYDKESGTVEEAYGDYIAVNKAAAIGEVVLMGLWGIAALMCIVMLIIKLIGKLRRKGRKPLGTWAVSGMLAQLCVLGLIGFAALCALNYAPSKSYIWSFAAVCALLAAMCALLVSGLIRFIKKPTEMSRGTKAFNILSLVSLAVSIANILYWNVFVFWKF